MNGATNAVLVDILQRIHTRIDTETNAEIRTGLEQAIGIILRKSEEGNGYERKNRSNT